MIKGMIIGAIAMYIYLVQPEWADQIIVSAKLLWQSIIDAIQNRVQTFIFFLDPTEKERMRSYKFHKDDERPTEDKKAENERLMQEFLKKGGKVEKIPYGITSQDLGVGNRNAFWDPPKTSTPKAWRRRETMKKKKKQFQ